MSKKSIAFIAQNGTVHDAVHIAPGSYLGCRNPDLIAMAICVFNRGAVNNSVKACP
jgi:hypothetical protein